MNFIFSFILNSLYVLFIWLIYKFTKVIYRNFIRKGLDLSTRYGKDSWVLVTGATDGLGKEYCNQFAQLGYNIIFVSRSMSKLKEVQKEFEERYPKIKTHVVEFDFSTKVSTGDYEEAFGKLQDQFDISVLVNNVGISGRNFFVNMKLEDMRNFINVNCLSQAMMTNILMKRMLNRPQHSAIISLSSFASTFPLALSSVYSATKIFNDYLSRGIKSELIGHKVDVLSVRPLYVATPMTRNTLKEFGEITVKESVKGALKCLGQDEFTYGHWKHELQAFIMNYIPGSVKNMIRLRTNKKIKIN